MNRNGVLSDGQWNFLLRSNERKKLRCKECKTISREGIDLNGLCRLCFEKTL